MTTLFTADLNNPYTKQLAVVPTTTSPPATSPSTQPPRSVGVTRRSLNLEVLFPPTIPKESIPKNLQDHTFQVEYQDIVAGEDFGSKRVFYFALLPAIESATTFSGENKFRGNADVPNVKRGIFTRTIMRQLNYPIPSGLPRVQAIAIDSKLMELVGAFIGTEEINQSLVGLQSDTLNSIYPTGSKDLATKQRKADTLPVSSYQSALLFDRRVVQQGKPVIVTIKTGEHFFKVQGVINQFEIHSVRRERTYYRITIIYTSYNKVRPLQSAPYQSVAGAGAGTGAGNITEARAEQQIKNLTQQIAQSPNASVLYVQRGDLYASLGRNADSINDYEKAIELLEKSNLETAIKDSTISQIRQKITNLKSSTPQPAPQLTPQSPGRAPREPNVLQTIRIRSLKLSIDTKALVKDWKGVSDDTQEAARIYEELNDIKTAIMVYEYGIEKLEGISKAQVSVVRETGKLKDKLTELRKYLNR